MKRVLISVAILAIGCYGGLASPAIAAYSNIFVQHLNLGGNASTDPPVNVTVGSGSASLAGQGAIEFNTGAYPLSGDPVSSSGFAYAVIEIIPEYFQSLSFPAPVCLAQIANFEPNGDPFSTTHPTVEHYAFASTDGTWHVQFFMRPLAAQRNYTLNFICPPKVPAGAALPTPPN
jgi:hypothetical protein